MAVTDSLAPGRRLAGRAKFARAVPGYGLNEALADLILTVMFDRVAGLAAGLVVGVLELGVVLLVIQAVAGAPPSTANVSSAARATPAIAVDHGVLTQVVVDLEPGIQRLLSPAIPSNIENRLDQYSAG
jgi:uncharacterized membrane protein required for colicin V production